MLLNPANSINMDNISRLSSIAFFIYHNKIYNKNCHVFKSYKLSQRAGSSDINFQ